MSIYTYLILHILFCILKSIYKFQYEVINFINQKYNTYIYKEAHMAQKNILQYILLGLISQKDMAGYDIKKLFNTELSDFWHANHSQIYPELRRLESEGYIEAKTEIVGEKLEKHFYHLTQHGLSVLHHWMKEPLSDVPPSKDEFPLKVYLIDDATNPLLSDLINEEIARHEAKLLYLKGRMTTISAADESPHYGHMLILRRAIHRENSYLLWLSEEKKSLDKLKK